MSDGRTEAGSGGVIPGPAGSPVLDVAQRGFAAASGLYAHGRPDYPPALGAWLRDALALGPGRSVVDLGAGTGKFTGLLVDTGAVVTAIEPVDAMRAVLAREWPGVRALAGTAQTMPLEDGSVDVVVCAQAFHWFATREALDEIHRVLKPDGRLGLVWNVRDQRVDWVAGLTSIIEPYEGDAPRHHTGAWRRPFEAGSSGFGPLAVTHFDYVHRGPPDQVVVDRFLSVSFIAALPEAERDQVAARLRALCRDHPALQGRDTVDFPYRTEAWVCRREG